jgi:hypothetical protein
MLFQNFNIIGFATRELHLSKVEGVELSISFSNLVKIVFLFRGITLDFKNKKL